MILKACAICGRPTSKGPRCPAHALPHKRSGSYTRAAAQVRAAATICAICGKPFNDPNDPAVADHIVPRIRGGSDRIGNLQPAHQSCNGRKGQQIGNLAW